MSELDPKSTETLNALAGQLDKGEIIAFVGAGASAELAPTWSALVERLAASVEDWHAIDRATLKWIANANPQYGVELISKHLTQPDLESILEAAFIWESAEFTRIHAALAALPFKGFVTTNYDRGLAEALRRRGVEIATSNYRNSKILAKWSDGSVFRDGRTPLLHIHGDIEDPANIVLDRESYRNAYGPDQVLGHLLSDLWRTGHLFFVGYGFSDPWLNFLCQQITIQVNLRASSGGHRHFALVGIDRDEVSPRLVRRYFKEVFDVDPIFYSIRRAANGRENHNAALQTLHTLKERCTGSWTATEPYPRFSGRPDYLVAPESTIAEVQQAQRETANRFDSRACVELDIGGEGLELVLVPAGCFRVGPREYRVDSPFFLSRHLVPVSLLERWCFGIQPMNQAEAIECIERLAHQCGQALTLPTELQWDLALGDGRGPAFGLDLVNRLEILADPCSRSGVRFHGKDSAVIARSGRFLVKCSGDLSTKPLQSVDRSCYDLHEALTPPAFRVSVDVARLSPKHGHSG